MDTATAIRQLRADPAHADLIRDAYLDADSRVAADRYATSAELSAALQLLGGDVTGMRILDVGAGNGLASVALARAGAEVVALDPDPGADVGLAALRLAAAGLPVQPVLAIGEAIPLADASVDAVFARQVLHHANDLAALVAECARVLRPGGVFLACREHVADDAAQLQEFLASHPVHQLAGGEHAFSKGEYLHAITESGLRVERVLGPWDSIVNAFPLARTEAEVRSAPRDRLAARWGVPGAMIGSLASGVVRSRLNRRGAGRLYTFLARRP